jgi:hypothetical protein
VLTLGLLEVALRVAPGALLPLKMLLRFRSEVRSTIAEQLGLPTASEVWTLARDDNGPAIQLMKPHARVVWDFRAPGTQGSIELDGQGFCNAATDSYDRPQLDLIVLGDSFAECILSDPLGTWPSRLGAITGRPVYNLGKGGVGPYEYIQIFKHFGVPKHPSIVVMNVYEGNDLRDSVRFHEHADAVQRGESPTDRAGERGEDPFDYQAALDNPLGRHSRVVNLIVIGAGQIFEGVRNKVMGAIGRPAPEQPDFRYSLDLPEGSVPFNVQNADQSEVRYARMLQSGKVSLDAFDDALDEFALLARENGFRGIVSYAPSAQTAYAPFVHYEDPSLADLMPWFSAEQRRHLAARSAELGLTFVDLTPAFQQAARERGGRQLLYHPVHVHYTPAGHEVAARALAPVIGSAETPR